MASASNNEANNLPIQHLPTIIPAYVAADKDLKLLWEQVNKLDQQRETATRAVVRKLDYQTSGVKTLCLKLLHEQSVKVAASKSDAAPEADEICLYLRWAAISVSLPFAFIV